MNAGVELCLGNVWQQPVYRTKLCMHFILWSPARLLRRIFETSVQPIFTTPKPARAACVIEFAKRPEWSEKI